MHDPFAARHPPVTVMVMPPREAYDYDLYMDRLADAWIVDASLALRTLRMPFLAVRVGGSRSGGSYSVTCSCFGLKVVEVLRGRDGYPQLRLRYSPSDDSYVVEWGERSPTLWGQSDVTTMGLFYGYTDRAISGLAQSPATS
ncbi:DUF6302 family protein [Streptomyces sp. NPDC058308]|uniref:DUF6302 family protein n=1 Tax=Streptomyces sp. NPDC058308 TaxID=3346440 RepID=UPI0036EBE7A0